METVDEYAFSVSNILIVLGMVTECAQNVQSVTQSDPVAYLVLTWTIPGTHPPVIEMVRYKGHQEKLQAALPRLYCRDPEAAHTARLRS